MTMDHDLELVFGLCIRDLVVGPGFFHMIVDSEIP
jgi:hypothetical protein